jgi:hypothetical protein
MADAQRRLDAVVKTAKAHLSDQEIKDCVKWCLDMDFKPNT